jgi:signal transduction histidine kinase
MRDREKSKKRLMSKLEDLRKVLDELQDALNEFHKAEEQIQEKIIEYEKLSALGRLTANVAHEIRNPITVIGGMTERLRKSFVYEPNQREYLDLISVEVKRLEDILRDVLFFSDKAFFQRELKDINEVIADVLNNYGDMIGNTSVTVQKYLDDVPHVYIDDKQVGAAIGNLISNAIDAMPGGGTLTITTRTEYIGGKNYVALRVIDAGVGIPEENLKMIYEPFFTTKIDRQDTGLGLATTRKIIEGHGGLIKVESTVGKGSAFTLYFPYRAR